MPLTQNGSHEIRPAAPAGELAGLLALGGALLLEITGELPDRLLRPRLAEGTALFPQSGPAVQKAALALQVLDDEHRPVNAGAASAQAYTVLMALHDAQAAQPGEKGSSRLTPLVGDAVAIIQEEFPFLEGVEELAQRLEVSKAHLIRTFTQKVGISPGKYITRTRIEYAKLLLQGGESSISYVAQASGYANANYFAKVFHRQTGMTPSEYLQASAGGGAKPLPKHLPSLF